MTHPMPEGEHLRKAVAFVSEQRKEKGEQDLVSLVDEASLRFDLSPEDASFLLRFVRESNASNG